MRLLALFALALGAATIGRAQAAIIINKDTKVSSLSAAALGAFRAIGGRDYARVDVMVRADGSPVVLEVNTLPGMTETSLLPKAAAAAGLSYAELCERMVELALDRKAFAPSRRQIPAARISNPGFIGAALRLCGFV